jgi:hypothetical protein
MYSNPLNSLEDAYEVIRRYGLDRTDFGGGSAAGFAAWLFVPGRGVADVSLVAEELAKYKEDFARNARMRVNLDEQLASEAADLTGTLEEHAKHRRELSEFIRSVKFGTDGGRVWAAVAELATTPPGGRAAVGESIAEQRPRVLATLAGLLRFESAFHDSLALTYSPGDDGQLDLMLRMDIERFDVTLDQAAPWAGKDPDWAYEMCALLRLAASGFAVVKATASNGSFVSTLN